MVIEGILGPCAKGAGTVSSPQNSEALRASHKAMLEALVQILEEVMYPIDKLMPEVESIIARAEQLAATEEQPRA